ncbi:MAG: hypothetical protein CO119_05380 [Flavobacteriales bacterium CG_4_9_14_3_um_filter_40_17]|nr:MAG: hypothetical protein CO119_05380 [Flavobacteriales bacterium CG_4_9_14_3_um_filter_40_17]
MSQHFKKWNTIIGWIIFGIALITYRLTVEPTASFWDAGEYISTSAKLQVGHPPGAPLFQMFGAVFSIFAQDEQQIALMVNSVSVVSSAFTILFLFWSLTILLRKIISRGEETFTDEKALAVLGSAAVGALAFTFSDSFWFNAVEAEVYAMAACIMSLMFWLGLRWEAEMHEPRGNRWLILISFVIGLSFGVHFMALLTIPAIGFLYYFKNWRKITVLNFIAANIVVVAILLVIFKLLLPYTLKFFGGSEVFFVNTFGLPFNSGTLIAGLIFIAIFYYAIQYTKNKNHIHLNSILHCVFFILVGFSCWIMLPIRANANVVINENKPADARELLAYYNREQYPETKLFYGPLFTEAYVGLDPDKPYLDDKPNYERDEKTGKYIIVNKWRNVRQNSDDSQKGFLPRMWSTDEENISNYMQFTGAVDFTIKPEYRSNEQLRSMIGDIRAGVKSGKIEMSKYSKFLSDYSEYIDVEKPSFIKNMKFLFEFQFNYMYWRYFMWNFVGREDDIQGKYDNHGNWISGIRSVDEFFLGYPQTKLPGELANNKGRNTYFFLPFLLGLIGLFYHYKKHLNYFWILLVFFLFMGIALKIYLNERAFEPRERDYALVGSFYVFSIWIGIGAFAVFDWLQQKMQPKFAVVLSTTVCLFAVPVLMAQQNWDDHDRSGKYTAQAIAKSYLDSCQENADAIIFTIGDNDTFAMWYAQEIEAYRTDVRTINTSLFATDWYIDQMKRKAYQSNPIPSQLKHDQYRYGTRDVLIYQKMTENTWNIKDFMTWISSDDPKTKVTLSNGEEITFYPTNKIRIPVDKETVLKNGIVKAKDSALIVPYIDIQIGNQLPKNRMMMLDILANNDWKRPIYFSGGSFDNAEYLWMKDYLQLDGLTYKLVPIQTKVDPKISYEMGRIDSETMYNNALKWDWGNMNGKIYHDPETRKNSINYRGNLARLADQLIRENQFDKAEKIMDLVIEKTPVEKYGYFSLLEPYVEGYYRIGKNKKAEDLFLRVVKNYQEYLVYFNQMSIDKQLTFFDEIITNIERYRSLTDLIVQYQDEEFVSKQLKIFKKHEAYFEHFYKE